MGANTSQSRNFNQPLEMASSYIPEQPAYFDLPYSHDTVVQNTAAPSAVHNTALSTSYPQHDSRAISYPGGQMAGGSGVNTTPLPAHISNPNSAGGYLDTLPPDIGDWGLFPGSIECVQSVVMSIIPISLSTNLFLDHSENTASNTLEFEEIDCLQTLFQCAKISIESTTDVGKFDRSRHLNAHYSFFLFHIRIQGR